MKARFLIPLVFFVGLIVLFLIGLGLNPREVPSPLIDKPVPEFALPRLHDANQQLRSADLRQGDVVLLNVWASWCTACREEHPFLMELARRGEITVYGLNYKDERSEALRLLKRDGDPYVASAFDHDGRVGIDWGVYGVPETFLIDGAGRIRHKHIGPLSFHAWQNKIQPLIAQIRAERK
ncbi:MAG: DsbE family thiol:disulfide interchange protein [Hydrogenophaga sp.]|nr:DsbE family thiol:disulfide interchange protein [Gammaproteobacteria bacterium]